MYVFLVEVPRVYIVVRVFLRIDRPLVEIQFASGFVIHDYDIKIQLTTCCLYMVLNTTVRVTVLSPSVEYTRIRWTSGEHSVT